LCRNGRYVERGIKQVVGYGSERWCVEIDYAVKLDPSLADVGVLMEPTSVVAKAWDEVQKVGDRAGFEPRTAIVTGAGLIGLLAALLGVQRGLDVHVLDRVGQGLKPDLVRALGATYHPDGLAALTDRVTPDTVIEATGAGPLVFGAIAATAPYGIVCLTGVSPRGRSLQVDAGGLNRDIVLENDVVTGSVNANHYHYDLAAQALAAADRDWLARLITSRVPLRRAAEAFEAHEDDVKVVLDLTAGADR